MLRAGKLPVGGVGVLGQVVGADDQKITAVGYKVLHGQAGGGDAQHHAELGVFVKGHAPLPQALAAVLHDVHGGVPVLHIGHHGEHHPQRAPVGGPQQGTDLRFKLAGLAQAVADAPQPQLGGLHPLVGVRHGAVGAKIEGAHGHRAALCRCKAGRIEVELLLLVQNAAGQHHVAAAQQAHAPGTGLHGGVDILRAEAVGQQLKGCAVPGVAGLAAQHPHFFVFTLQLTDAGLGLLAGGSVRRKAPPVAAEQFYGKLAALPRLPQLMGVLVMAVLCGVYTLFFAVQAAEFAAALGAPLPLTAPDAAAFAVNGFWEFCRILALDLTVLAALHFLGAQPVTQKGLSRVLAVALCGFGAGFAMLAAAKLAVYINLYGPTVRRIWAAWVLGALLLASVLAAVRLFRCIPAARMAFVAAAFSFSLLCCLPLERFCVDAQLARPDCDWQLLQRYTWQSSELDEYITQQAGENANLSE